jgi:hypothetical protein
MGVLTNVLVLKHTQNAVEPHCNPMSQCECVLDNLFR